jgi:hypothetical protein
MRGEVGVDVPEATCLGRAPSYKIDRYVLSAVYQCMSEEHEQTSISLRHQEQHQALVLYQRLDIDVLVLFVLEHEGREGVANSHRGEFGGGRVSIRTGGDGLGHGRRGWVGVRSRGDRGRRL